jgi:Cdc6-like AAA superfamily ATPase
MNAIEILALKQKIASVFTPSAPIDRATLFAGRKDQITKLMNAISQKGQHAILFGERGVGKTSLANVLRDFLKELKMEGYLIGSTNCEKSSTFSSIWTAALRDIPVVFNEIGMGFKPTINSGRGTLADVCSKLDGAESVRHFFQSFTRHCIIIIDEIDQIKTRGTSKALADAIKTLSDRAVATTIILVGVADSVNDLIAEHVSIERALVQIPMPRMSPEELLEIVDKGLKEAQMTSNQPSKNPWNRPNKVS